MRLSQDALSTLHDALTTLGYQIQIFTDKDPQTILNCPSVKVEENKWIAQTGMEFYRCFFTSVQTTN